MIYKTKNIRSRYAIAWTALLLSKFVTGSYPQLSKLSSVPLSLLLMSAECFKGVGVGVRDRPDTASPSQS